MGFSKNLDHDDSNFNRNHTHFDDLCLKSTIGDAQRNVSKIPLKVNFSKNRELHITSLLVRYE